MALLLLRVNALKGDYEHSYFFLSTESGECRSLPRSSVIASLKAKTVEYLNIALSDSGKVVGTNGMLNRYPLAIYNSIDDIINNNAPAACTSTLGNKPSVIVVSKDDATGTFAVCDYLGKIAKCSEAELIKKCQDTGVQFANASIVDGKFIRAIRGDFNVNLGFAKDIFNEEAQKALDDAKAKMDSEVAEYRKITEQEADERKQRFDKVKSNYAPKQGKIAGHYEVDGEKVEVDSETIKELHKEREKALARIAKTKERNKISKLNSEYKLSTNSKLDCDSVWAKAVNSESIVQRSGITVEEKIALAATTIKYIDPFLYGIYRALDKIILEKPIGGLWFMGVSDDKLYIIEETALRFSVPKLSWTLMHELSHIIMLHPLRFTRYQKMDDPTYHKLYNIATDLFINKYLAKNYGCRPGAPVQKLLYKNIAPIGLEFAGEWYSDKGWERGLYDESIDTDKTTVDMIFQKLLEENMQKIKQQQSMGGNGNSGDGNSSGSGSSSKTDNNSGNDNGNGSGSQNNNSSEQGEQSGQSGSSGEEQSGQYGNNDEQTQSGESNKSSGNESNKQSGDSGSGNNAQDDNKDQFNDINNTGSVDITYNGNKVAELPVDGDYKGGDLFSDDDSDKHGDTEAERERWGRNFARKMIQKAANMGFDPKGDSPFARELQDATAQDFVWTRFIAQYMNKIKQDEYSYRRPDKKMMNYGLVVKGRNKGEVDAAEDVIVAIDVSGSVSDDELGKAFDYIRVVMKKYDISGGVCFWSTDVDGIYKFKNKNEFLAIRKQQFKTTGGTDANCLFQWIKDNKRKFKTKLVIVITDGCFSEVKKELRPGRGTETVWIITENSGENYRDYDFGFGKVAPLVPKK